MNHRHNKFGEAAEVITTPSNTLDTPTCELNLILSINTRRFRLLVPFVISAQGSNPVDCIQKPGSSSTPQQATTVTDQKLPPKDRQESSLFVELKMGSIASCGMRADAGHVLA
jgi:hypothetical protein